VEVEVCGRIQPVDLQARAESVWIRVQPRPILFVSVAAFSDVALDDVY